MKPAHFFEARRKLEEMMNNPQYRDALIDRLSPYRNPKICYQYMRPAPGEYFVSLHNHSDSGCHSIRTMAEVAARRGYKIFGITDHNLDLKFDGQRVRHYNFEGREIFVIRGMECRCRTENSPMKDLIFLGYENGLKPFKDIEGTIDYCKEKKGIVLATSSFNEGARGLSREQLDRVVSGLDGIETLNSCSGGCAFSCYDVLAEEYADEKGKTGIFANDAHTLREIGLAGFGVAKDRLKVLEEHSPKEIVAHPDLLIDVLRDILHEGRVHNYGTYIPKCSIFYPDKFATLSHKHAVLRPG